MRRALAKQVRQVHPVGHSPPASTNSLAWYMPGSRFCAARVTMRLCSPNNIGLGNTIKASARSLIIAENALAKSAQILMPRPEMLASVDCYGPLLGDAKMSRV